MGTKQYRRDHREELAAKQREYYQEHKEEAAEYKKKYQKKYKKEIAVKRKEHRENNKEVISARKKQYYQKNKVMLAAKSKKYHEEHRAEKAAYDNEHKEEIAATRRKRYQTSEGKAIVQKYNNKRRALKKNAEYEVFDPVEIFERDGYRCQFCRKKTRPDFNQHHPLYPNLDHIISLSKGGSHTRQNTQCLCRMCNLKKSNNDSGAQLRLFG